MFCSMVDTIMLIGSKEKKGYRLFKFMPSSLVSSGSLSLQPDLPFFTSSFYKSCLLFLFLLLDTKYPLSSKNKLDKRVLQF